MAEYFREKVGVGTFRIRHVPRGWMLWLDDDCFDGPFDSAESALEQLVSGHSGWPVCGDPSLLGLPDALYEWNSRTVAR